MTAFLFESSSKDPHSYARTGQFHTPHGIIETPAFFPCGTKGVVKTMSPDELIELGCQGVLANTFHLMLRPGEELVAKMGGLHEWMQWKGPIVTDSGGFQVFSLARLRKIDDEGVTFHSPIDGSTHRLTPERAIEIQEKLGADIIMAFDECPPGMASREETESAMQRTHAWFARCLKAKKRTDQALFPIIQGGRFPDLRKISAEFLTKFDTPGIAIGGVAVGEPKASMIEVLETVSPLLPEEKLHYLMGIGEPLDILKGVAYGIDLFDCVLPTRLARHGAFWTTKGRVNIRLALHSLDTGPLDVSCRCFTCQRFSRSYLRHLVTEKEMLGSRLLTIHNLHFLLELMRQIRHHIQSGTFQQFSAEFASRFHE